MTGHTQNAWRESLPGDELTFQRGFDITKAQQAAGEYPVISSSGPNSTHADFMVQSPGVVIGRKGSLGTVFYNDGPYWPHDTTLWVKDFHGNDPKYSYYFLKTMHFETYDTGASNPTLNRNHIHLLPVLLPPLPTQRRIADILSAYDDLIENNTRRIALLEELAQSLYREWFVHFRYPGHEHVPLVETPLGPAPAGWEVKPFAEVADFVNGFAFKPEHWGASGKPIIKIAELKNGVTDKSPRYGGDDIPAKYHIQNRDLLFSWSADLDVYLWAGGDALLNQHLFTVLPYPGFDRLFLFHALSDRMSEFRSRAQGTTMRHIKRSALTEVHLVVPPRDLRQEFRAHVEPVTELVLNLGSATTALRHTRDLLLPKLVAGEVDAVTRSNSATVTLARD